MSTGGKQLVKDGAWQVPPEERPVNWQAMGIKGPEGSTAVAVMEAPEQVAVAVKEVEVIAPTAVAPTYSMANHPSELADLQDSLTPWAKAKLEEVRLEHSELSQAIEHAKKCKWNWKAMGNAATSALSRITFYEKVVAALEAGYMLFPPVPNADVIALRCVGNQLTNKFQQQNANRRSPSSTVTQKPLPAGVGTYLNPVTHWKTIRKWKDEKGNEIKEWMALQLGKPEFPLLMAKPQVVEAVNAAMEMKVFDDIRIFPFERRAKGDPCILGSIADRATKKRHYFLISWRIDAKDI